MDHVNHVHFQVVECNIIYFSIKFEEVSGSNHYIDKDGQINYQTLLRGIYWSSNLHSSIRLCEYLLKTVFCLFELCPLTRERPKAKKNPKNPNFIKRSHDESVHSSVNRLSAPVSRRTLFQHHHHHTQQHQNNHHQRNQIRSKSVALPGLHLGLNYISSNGGRSVSQVHSRPRGSSTTPHDENGGSMDKLSRVGGRFLSFGRSRNRGQETEVADMSADVSSDEDSGSRTLHKPGRSGFQKADRYLNAEKCSQVVDRSGQVRFQSRRESERCLLRRGAEIPTSGPTRVLSNGVLVVTKKPQRKPRILNGTKLAQSQQSEHPQYGSAMRNKVAAQIAEEQQQATTNYCLVMEILVK